MKNIAKEDAIKAAVFKWGNTFLNASNIISKLHFRAICNAIGERILDLKARL